MCKKKLDRPLAAAKTKWFCWHTNKVRCPSPRRCPGDSERAGWKQRSGKTERSEGVLGEVERLGREKWHFWEWSGLCGLNWGQTDYLTPLEGKESFWWVAFAPINEFTEETAVLLGTVGCTGSPQQQGEVSLSGMRPDESGPKRIRESDRLKDWSLRVGRSLGYPLALGSQTRDCFKVYSQRLDKAVVVSNKSQAINP